jgi:hypothetical protein
MFRSYEYRYRMAHTLAPLEMPAEAALAEARKVLCSSAAHWSRRLGDSEGGRVGGGQEEEAGSLKLSGGVLLTVAVLLLDPRHANCSGVKGGRPASLLPPSPPLSCSMTQHWSSCSDSEGTFMPTTARAKAEAPRP